MNLSRKRKHASFHESKAGLVLLTKIGFQLVESFSQTSPQDMESDRMGSETTRTEESEE